jgi:hypothetical protein
LALVVLAISCGRPAEPANYPGASRAVSRPEPIPVPSAHPPPPRRWNRYEEVLSWPPAPEKPFPSLGHFSARYSAVVHVDASARDGYLNLVAGSLLPVGATVAELHTDPRTGQPGPLLAMHKIAANRWEYLVVDALGRIEERGELPLCQRCHADGVADHLFGLPRPAE